MKQGILDDWRHRILQGLRESRLLLACQLPFRVHNAGHAQARHDRLRLVRRQKTAQDSGWTSPLRFGIWDS